MMKQEYDKYTKEDHQVWSILFARQMKNLPGKATNEFLTGIDKVGFEQSSIPRFDTVNEKLDKLTGWQLYPVPGIVSNKEFFELLAQKKFPATTWLRKMKQLDYLEEPDMFHDVFAHVPLLSNQQYCDFLHRLSKIVLKKINDSWIVELVSRIYWFTIEFGLIKEQEQVKIYGAGILSSNGETDYCLGEKPTRLPFNAKEILDSPYIKSEFQKKYFVINSYEQLFDCLKELDEQIEKKSIKT